MDFASTTFELIFVYGSFFSTDRLPISDHVCQLTNLAGDFKKH